MVALTGERYGELPNAFRYRTEYCRCLHMQAEAMERRGQSRV